MNFQMAIGNRNNNRETTNTARLAARASKKEAVVKSSNVSILSTIILYNPIGNAIMALCRHIRNLKYHKLNIYSYTIPTQVQMRSKIGLLYFEPRFMMAGIRTDQSSGDIFRNKNLSSTLLY